MNEQPSTIELLKHLNWRRYLIALSPILIILLVVVGYFIFENVTGSLRIKKLDRQLLTEGLKLDFEDIPPDTPPAENNFASSKYISAIFDFEWINGIHYNRRVDLNEFRASYHKGISIRTSGSWTSGSSDYYFEERPSGKRIDLEKAESLIYFAPEVLREIDSFANRTTAAYSLKVNNTSLGSTWIPYLSDPQNFAYFNKNRAQLAILKNDRETAQTCLKISLRITDLYNSSPSWIAMMIKISVNNFPSDIIWHGIEKKIWTTDDYRNFIQWIPTTKERSNEYLQQINGAIIFGRMLHNEIQSNPKMHKNSFGSNYKWIWLIPPGSWQHNIAEYSDIHLNRFYTPIKKLDFVTTPSYPKRSRNPTRAIVTEATVGGWQTLIQSLDNMRTRIARSLVEEKLVRIACAIELYQLENNKLPANLTTLMPGYIENVDDLMNPGKPLVYRIDSKEKRHWTLYSIGQNGVDDGGVVEWISSKKERNYEKGDWVWAVPMQQQVIKPARSTVRKPKPGLTTKTTPSQ